MTSVFIFILFLCTYLTASCESISYFTTVESSWRMPIDVLPPDAIIERIECFADIPVDMQELCVTMGFNDTVCSAADIERAIERLYATGRYAAIKVTFQEIENSSSQYILRLNIEAAWLLHHITISGLWVNKETYKRHYLMEIGDRFIPEKHDESMRAMQTAFHNDGYRAVVVNAHVQYDSLYKYVDVEIEVDRGPRYVIENACAKYEGDISDTENFTETIERTTISPIIGSPCTAEIIQHAQEKIRAYYTRAGFYDVDVVVEQREDNERYSVDVTYYITLSECRSIIFMGCSQISESVLRDVINAFEQATGILPSSVLAHELLEYYHTHGYWDVQIEAEEDGDTYYFIIQEGQAAIVSEVCITGITSEVECATINRMARRIALHEIATQERLQRCLDSIIQWYVNHGYPHATIHNYEYKPSEQGGHILSICVDTGTQLTIDRITVHGLPEQCAQGVESLLYNVSSRLFTPRMIEDQQQLIKNYLRIWRMHNISLNSRLETQIDRTTHLIWLVRNVTDKPSIGAIIVRGLAGCDTTGLRNLLSIKEGDEWDIRMVQRAQAELKTLDMYDSVVVHPLVSDNPIDMQDVVVHVVPASKYELRMRAGVAAQQVSKHLTTAGATYKIGGTGIIRQITDAADLVRFDFDIARSERRIFCTYIRPWLWYVPVKTLVKLYDTAYKYPGCIGISKNLYNIHQAGALSSIEHEWGFCDASCNLGLEWMKITFGSTIESDRLLAARISTALDVDPTLIERSLPFFFIEPTVMIDLADDNLYPHCGSFTVLSAKLMAPISNKREYAFFVRFLLEHSLYIPLKSWVFALRLRVGHIFNTDFWQIMPSERFYLGGANSVRAYQTDRCPPLGAVQDCGETFYVPQGGKSMANIIAEFRIPVWRDIAIALFQDIGVLSANHFSAVVAKNIVAATGFGVRYATPIGPLRIDIGWKTGARIPHGKNFAWFLTFGYPF